MRLSCLGDLLTQLRCRASCVAGPRGGLGRDARLPRVRLAEVVGLSGAEPAKAVGFSGAESAKAIGFSGAESAEAVAFSGGGPPASMASRDGRGGSTATVAISNPASMLPMKARIIFVSVVIPLLPIRRLDASVS